MYAHSSPALSFHDPKPNFPSPSPRFEDIEIQKPASTRSAGPSELVSALGISARPSPMIYLLNRVDQKEPLTLLWHS